MDWHQPEQWTDIRRTAGPPCAGIVDRLEAEFAPVNLKLLFLPPYSPELNPQEHVWDELREKCFHNKTFDSLNLLEDHLVTSLNVLETQYETIQNIVAWDWVISACSIGN
jgi:transposase